MRIQRVPVYCVLRLKCESGREKERWREGERGRKRGRVVSYVSGTPTGAGYRLYSIGTYGNAALALVQADSKTVITS